MSPFFSLSQNLCSPTETKPTEGIFWKKKFEYRNCFAFKSPDNRQMIPLVKVDFEDCLEDTINEKSLEKEGLFQFLEAI